jgi:phosphoglycerol transferase MdoB-like AlkP superfamily enzyme
MSGREKFASAFEGDIESFPTGNLQPASAPTAAPFEKPRSQANGWAASARFLLVWIYPAALALYLKWYLMADEQGFVREARSMGSHSLSTIDRLVFFRADLIFGGLVVPAALLLAMRWLPVWLKASITFVVSAFSLSLVGVQLFSLELVGRFCSWGMLKIAVGWGMHESGSNVKYLYSAPALLFLLFAAAMLATLIWAVRAAYRVDVVEAPIRWKTAGELYCFALIALVLVSLHSDVLQSPYEESTLLRSVSSLWQAKAIDLPEFFGFQFEQHDHFNVPDFSGNSDAELVEKYRQLSNAPAEPSEGAFFGTERGANVLFFILETTPEEYLPVNGDLGQFPNVAGLRERSFVGERHYTTFPLTRCALFSMFSSWYPIDEPKFVFGPVQNDRPPDFLRLLRSRGYTSAIFSPLKSSGISDDVVFRVLGFENQYYPSSAISDYNGEPSWRQARIAADEATLQLLLQQIKQWNSIGQRFVAAFAPQISHYPYPDNDRDNSPAGLKRRARALLSDQDAWLGEIVNLLRTENQLQNTIIVIVGDHGPRTIEENPALRRGTIDETAFHVPLFIYAPRALKQTHEISWLTSHIDLAPTILDLLGESRNRSVEQGAPIWDAALQQRTTFFFARQMFGADGYFQNGRFYMWHYFSNTVYQSPEAIFSPSGIAALKSRIHLQVTQRILQMAGIEQAWHARFDEPRSDLHSQQANNTGR